MLTPMSNLKDSCLTAFGFIEPRLSTKRKRLELLESLVSEVADSQADSDYEAFSVPTTTEAELAKAFGRLASPTKQRKSYHSEQFNLEVVLPPERDEECADVALSTPTKQESRHTEIPSSLPYERYNHRRWSEPDTPRSILHSYRINSQRGLGIMTSAWSSVSIPHFEESSPFTVDNYATKTPLRPERQLNTPPNTRLASNRDIEKVSESSAIQILSDAEPESPGAQDENDKENKRPPFTELAPTLVPSSQARASRHFSASPSQNRRSPLRQTTTTTLVVRNSSDLSPTDHSSKHDDSASPVWHDAPEFSSQIKDTPVKHRPSSSQVAAVASASIYPDSAVLRRLHTIEDSQQDSTEDIALPDNSPPQSPPMPLRTHSSDQQQQNSLWNTLLPPGFTSSQYEPMTPGLNSLSQTCPRPPPLSDVWTQTPESLTASKRKWNGAYAADKKRQKHRQLSDDEGDGEEDDIIEFKSPTPGPAGMRRRVSLQTALSTLPSTADE